MKYLFLYAIFGGSLLFSVSVQAQVRFEIGPQVGYNLATANYKVANTSDTGNISYRSGLETGLTADLGFTHWAIQAAVLYSQKGYKLEQAGVSSGAGYSYQSTSALRFDYLSIPLNVVLTSGAAGDGWRVFAGSYVGLLIGGRYRYTDQLTYSNGQTVPAEGESRVKAGDSFSSSPTDNNFYSRRLDTGAQAGIGYHYHNVLVQATYSLGLRNLGAAVPGSTNSPTYHNRAFEASLAYLFKISK